MDRAIYMKNAQLLTFMKWTLAWRFVDIRKVKKE